MALREAGFVCEWVQDISPSISDRQVLDLSVAGALLLVTEDGDFGHLIFREGLAAHGVVGVRLSRYDGEKEEIAAAVALQIAGIADGLIGNYTTLEPDRARQRALPSWLDDRD